MWLDSIRKLLGLESRSRRVRKQRPARKWRAPHIGVELLEDRLAPAASVTTNLADYYAGQTALFTASGFDKGSTVQFRVAPATTPTSYVFSSSVKDGSGADLDHMKNGSVQTNWIVQAAPLYILTATGMSGGKMVTASTTFTDAPSHLNLDFA